MPGLGVPGKKRREPSPGDEAHPRRAHLLIHKTPLDLLKGSHLNDFTLSDMPTHNVRSLRISPYKMGEVLGEGRWLEGHLMFLCARPPHGGRGEGVRGAGARPCTEPHTPRPPARAPPRKSGSPRPRTTGQVHVSLGPHHPTRPSAQSWRRPPAEDRRNTRAFQGHHARWASR